MNPEDMSPEDIKDAMRVFSMLKANIENWKYVETNKHLLPREKLEQTITQMLDQLGPIIDAGQLATELWALTTLDPHDLV